MLRALWLLLFVACPVLAGEISAPRVEFFSPQGTVKSVRQATARFSEAMVALGDPRLPAPFEMDCPEKGAGRWADTRHWVYDFDRDLPAGVVCRFSLKPDLRSLAGKPLSGKTQFAFDTGGPAIRASLPEEGDTRIDERQAFVLALDAPAGLESIHAHARCEISGLSEQVEVDLLSGEAQEKILSQRRQLGYAYYDLLWKNGEETLVKVKDETLQKAEELLVVLQCRRALPPETEVRLIWGKGVRAMSGVATAQDQVLRFKTRPAFTARLQCQRVNAQAACLPMLPMKLSFTAPVKAEDLMRTRLVDGKGKVYPSDAIDPAKTPYADEVSFRGPFPEKAQLRVELPGEFRDDAGRPLENAARFPLPTATDEYPPLAKFSGDFGIIEREVGGILPVTLRNLEPAVAGQRMVVEAPNGIPGQVKRLDQNDGEIARWIERVRKAGELRGEWLEGKPGEESKWKEETGSASVFGAEDRPEPMTLPKPLGEKEFEVVGIPLEKSGFYVVELASPKLGASLLGENRPRYVATAALVTHLAVHFKWGREASVVWVTTLDKAEPVKGAEVRIGNYCSGQQLWTGKTGEDGIARIGANVLGKPYGYSGCEEGSGSAPLFVSARTPDDLGFTVSSWNNGIQPSDFNLRTGDYEGSELIHTVLDRALFRAGETVSMKHFLRRHSLQGFDLPEKFVPDAVELTHTGSDQQYKLPVRFDGQGIAETTWSIPRDAKLGAYRIALVDAQQAQRFESGMFHVEQFRLPTMKAEIQPPAEPLVNARSVPLDLFVAYLSGGGAGNAPVKLRTLVEPKAVRFPDYRDYSFGGDPVREGVTQENDLSEEETVRKPAQVLALTLDAQGAQRTTLTELPVSPKPQDLIAELEYQDANGELEAITRRIPLWPAKLAVGLRTEDWAATRDQVRFRAVVLDLAGKPVARQPVSVELFQRTYYSYRKRLIGGFYAYDNRAEIKHIGGSCTGATDDQGLLLCTVAPDVAGEVLLQAKTKDDQGNEALAVTSTWVAGEEDWWFEGGPADRMDVLPEKQEYQPGETARFQVRMPFRNATALVSVEREGVAETFVTRLSGKTPVIEVPIQGHHSPNVFVSVLAVRGRVGASQSWLADMARKLHLPWRMDGGAPTALADLGKPAYRLGNAEIKVGWSSHRLDVKVESAASAYKVRDTAKAKLTVKRADGGPLPSGTEVALAAVDEALLELKPNASWQLLEKMMGVRPIEVYTSTAQMQVVGKRHYGRKAVPHGGGGGRQAARELFDTLLLWKGRLPVNERGEAEVDIPLNDSLTSFRVVAVASGGLGLFGTGSGTLRTTQDLILHSGLPSLVREGDRFSGVFTVRNVSQRPMTLVANARVSGEAGAAALPDFPARTMELAPGAARELNFDVTVPVGVEKLLWEITAREMGGGVAEDCLRVRQEVIPVHPVRVFQATLEQVDKPLAMDIRQPAGAIPGRGGVRVDLQARLGDATAGIAEYMARYPYTCLEQKASQAIALRDKSRWNSVMAQLPAYLDRDGLLKYFPSDWLAGSDVLTAYLLAIAHEAGWEPPEKPRARMIEALKGFVTGRIVRDSALPTADLSIRKLAAVDALARYGEATPELLDSIAIEPNLWPTSAVLDWYGILARLENLPEREQRKQEAEQILRARLNFQGSTLGFSTEREDALWWLMLSGDVNAVRMLLDVLNEPGWRADIPRLVRGAVGRQQQGRWNTTTANAWGVLALEKFSAAFELVPVTGETQATLADATQSFAWTPKARSGGLDFPWPTSQASLAVRHEGAGKPWAMLQAKAALPLTVPLSTGFKLNRTVTPVEQKQSGGWTRGDTARITLELEAQSDMTWVVVDDPIPAGATVLGTGLGRDAPLLTQGERREGWAWPAYEERRFDAFRAYYRFVPKGQWTVEYTVRFNNPGRFELPATRIEALYAPEMLGEYPNATVEVKAAP